MSAEWTSPADLRAQVERLWSKGRLLADETLFPLELKLRRPESRALSERFEEVRSWIRDLESEPAFRIEWAEGAGAQAPWILADASRRSAVLR